MISQGLKNASPDDLIIISDVDEIKKEWFYSAQSVGICGATSTPLWLMENVSAFISELN